MTSKLDLVAGLQIFGVDVSIVGIGVVERGQLQHMARSGASTNTAKIAFAVGLLWPMR